MASKLHPLPNSRIESREAFCVWMCEQHNMVNKKVGKPIFPCDMSKLDARWRDGSERCKVPPDMDSSGNAQAATPVSFDDASSAGSRL